MNNLGKVEELLKQLIIVVSKLQAGTHRVAITDGAAYSNADGFFLYVGVPGDVAYTDKFGNTGTQHFVAGYHPVPLTAIAASGGGTTATDLAACF